MLEIVLIHSIWQKKVLISNIYWEYLKTVEILGARFGLNEKDVSIRYFYFAYEQVLQMLWVLLYKDEVSFKVSEQSKSIWIICLMRDRRKVRSSHWIVSMRLSRE